MKLRNKPTPLALSACLLLLFPFLFSCKKVADLPEVAKISVYLTDAPAPFTEVNVNIQSVYVRYADHSKGQDGWKELKYNESFYELLHLQNGVSAVLSEAQDIERGKLEAMRINMGQGNNIMLENGQVELLKMADANFTVMLDLKTELELDKEIMITVDFDAGRSVRENDSGFELVPTVSIKSVFARTHPDAKESE